MLGCPACGHGAATPTKFCSACGADMRPAPCSACGTHPDAGARFCPECGTPLDRPADRAEPPVTPPARGEQRKTVTALFCDLVGSTAMQESLDPETGRQIMRRYYDVAEGVVARFGGHVDAWAGDGLCAVWGVPEIAEDDALRAVRAAWALTDGVAAINAGLERDFGVTLHTRIGLNTGEAVVSADRRLVGDVMNTAARLESAAPPDGVLMGESTWRLVRHDVTATESDPVVAKGKSQPVRAFRVLDTEPPEAAPRTPYAGREQEQRRLREAWQSALDNGTCRLVSVIGSPGLGKSRLAEQIAEHVSGQGGLVLTGGCDIASEAATWLPVAEFLGQAVGVAEGEGGPVILDRLRGVLDDTTDTERVVSLAGAVLGVGAIAPADETFWAIREVLAAVARRRPVLVMLDDLHWATAQLLDLVEYLADWLRDAPVLLLALARPELRDLRAALAVPRGRTFDVIDLQPLDDATGRELVRGMLGDVDVPPDVAAAALTATGGNPLFLSELLRMLVDDGTLVRQAGTWVLAPGAVVDVPPTVEALLSARLERLGPREREIVQRASVIGRQFYRGAVAELVAPGAGPSLDADLEALRRREMVEPDGTFWINEQVYRFHHVLIRDAAYRALLKDTRADLHERFATWLEDKLGDLLGDHEEIVAFHLEQAHEYRRQLDGPGGHRGPGAAGPSLGDRASSRLASAGRRALAREDAAAAANLLGRAVACLDRPGADLLVDQLDALLSDGRAQEAKEVLTRMDGLPGDPRNQALASVARGQYAAMVGRDDVDRDALGAAVDHFRDSGDSRRRAQALELVGMVEVARGQYAAAEGAFTEALGAARAADDARRIARVLSRAPLVTVWGPMPISRASGQCMDVIRMLGLIGGSAPVEAQTWRAQALLAAMRGHWEPADNLLTRSREVFSDLGLRQDLALVDLAQAQVELLRDRPGQAERAARKASQQLEALGMDGSGARVLLARALLGLGRVEEAQDLLPADSRDPSSWSAGGGNAVRAEILARLGQVEEGLALATATAARAHRTDALVDRGLALESLARVRDLAGDAAGAADALQQARDNYAAKEHTVGLARTGGSWVEGVPESVTSTSDVGRLQDGAEEHRDALVVRRLVELANARDLEPILDIYAGDFELVDTRALGWQKLDGPDGAMSIFTSWIELVPDVEFRSEPMGRIENLTVGLFGGHATGPDGDVGEVMTGQVISFDSDGRIHRVWMTDPDTQSVMTLAARLVEERREVGRDPSA